MAAGLSQILCRNLVHLIRIIPEPIAADGRTRWIHPERKPVIQRTYSGTRTRRVPLITYSATVVSLWNSSENNKTNFLAFWILHSLTLYGWLGLGDDHKGSDEWRRRRRPWSQRWMMMKWLWQRNAGAELDRVNVLWESVVCFCVIFAPTYIRIGGMSGPAARGYELVSLVGFVSGHCET